MPIDAKKIDAFDPFKVPTIRSVVGQTKVLAVCDNILPYSQLCTELESLGKCSTKKPCMSTFLVGISSHTQLAYPHHSLYEHLPQTIYGSIHPTIPNSSQKGQRQTECSRSVQLLC